MKIFLISPFPLTPIRSGAARRSMALAEHLQKKGYRVSIFSPTSEPAINGPSFRWRSFKQRFVFQHLFNVGLFRALLQETRTGCDAILLSFPFQILPVLLIALLKRKPLYLDAHNVEYVRLFSLGRPLAGALVFILESLAVACAKEVFAVSQEDQSLFKKRFGRACRLVPNGVDTQSFLPPLVNETVSAPKPCTILFFGNLAYKPNRDAVSLINEILAPYLARELPKAILRIAGPYAPRFRFAPNVEVLGPVRVVQEEIAKADLIIAPLSEASGGGGTRLKIVEAMACGKNILSTPAAAAGLPPLVQRALRLASLEEFGPEILSFFRGGWNQNLSATARTAALSLDWNRCFEDLQLGPHAVIPLAECT